MTLFRTPTLEQSPRWMRIGFERVRALAVALVAVLAASAGIAGIAVPASAVTGDPIGNLEGPSLRLSETAPGSYTYAIEGWAADPSAPGQPTDIHIYVDGQSYIGTRTNQPRPDVQAAFPWAGPNAGFESSVNHRGISGPVTVCAYAINVGAGSTNTTLGCQTLPVPGTDGGEPIGSLDEVTTRPGIVHLRGWGGDRDAGAATVPVRVYIDNIPTMNMLADKPRPDVAAAFPTLDATTGFDDDLPVFPGPHTICAYAGNLGRIGLANTPLGCADVTVADSTPVGPNDPRGNLEEITTYFQSGPLLTMYAKGWAFDPDSPGPWTVRVRVVISSWVAPTTFPVVTGDGTTSIARPDVRAVYPAAGPSSGFGLAGSQGSFVGYVYGCAYAVQVPPGSVSETFLGCRTPTPYVPPG